MAKSRKSRVKQNGGGGGGGGGAAVNAVGAAGSYGNGNSLSGFFRSSCYQHFEFSQRMNAFPFQKATIFLLIKRTTTPDGSQFSNANSICRRIN